MKRQHNWQYCHLRQTWKVEDVPNEFMNLASNILEILKCQPF